MKVRVVVFMVFAVSGESAVDILVMSEQRGWPGCSQTTVSDMDPTKPSPGLLSIFFHRRQGIIT